MSRYEIGSIAVQFDCEWGVFQAGSDSSLCYATSKERAEWIAGRLNELEELKEKTERHSGNESDWYQSGWNTEKSSGPVSEGGVWRRVSFAADCIGGDKNEPGDICSICGEDYCDFDCPGPTQDGYEYREVNGVLYARELSEEPEPIWNQNYE